MDWLQFQEMVARIERVAADREATVRSPDYLVDGVTGARREVDVSIRQKVGTAEILIVIEARRHQSVQDVTWIEQLVTKRDSLRASLLIAVSSSGFSTGAVALAESKGIALRHLSEMTESTIESMLTPVFHVTPEVNVKWAAFKPMDADALIHLVDLALDDQAALRASGALAPIIHHSDLPGARSLFDLLRIAWGEQWTRQFDDCRESGSVQRTFTIATPEGRLFVQTPTGRRRLEKIYIEAVLTVKRTHVPPDLAFKYQRLGQSALHHAEYEVFDASGGTRLTVQADESIAAPKVMVELRDTDGQLRPAKLEFLRRGRMVNGKYVEE